ncbi:MAG: hypothetical protein KGL39_54210 [Patescibacteria group bacterium]|nr:hypothetical protein [Patescibacteria group bacterium]
MKLHNKLAVLAGLFAVIALLFWIFSAVINQPSSEERHWRQMEVQARNADARLDAGSHVTTLACLRLGNSWVWWSRAKLAAAGSAVFLIGFWLTKPQQISP